MVRRRSGARGDEDEVSGEAGQETDEEPDHEEFVVAELERGTKELNDDVEDRARSKRQERKVKSVVDEALSHDRADQGGSATDQSHGDQERPRRLVLLAGE